MQLGEGAPAGLYPGATVKSFDLNAAEGLFDGLGVLVASLSDRVHVRYPDGHETLAAAIQPEGCPAPGKLLLSEAGPYCDSPPISCTLKGTGALPTGVAVVRTNDDALHLVYVEQDQDRDVVVNAPENNHFGSQGTSCGTKTQTDRSKSLLVVARIEGDGKTLTKETVMPVSLDNFDNLYFLASGGDGVHVLFQSPDGLPAQYRHLALK